MTKVIYVDRPSIAEVRQSYAVLNKTLFGGVLPAQTALRWQRMRWNGDCEEPNERYPYGLIRLSTMMEVTCGWLGILLHEMVHLYMFMLYPHVDEWDQFDWHGQQFCDVCNHVARQLDWPEVEVEDCWNWPECLELPFSPERPDEHD